MKTEQDLIEYIGQRIDILRKEINESNSRLQKEKREFALQEYKELLEFYLDK